MADPGSEVVVWGVPLLFELQVQVTESPTWIDVEPGWNAKLTMVTPAAPA